MRERCGSELNVLERIERNVLKCFGHMEIIGEEKFIKRVHQATVEGIRGERETTEKIKG